MCSNASETAAGFLKVGRYRYPRNTKRGDVVNGKNKYSRPEKQGFRIQDILWALGIWSVILTLSPVVLFYVLMVN